MLLRRDRSRALFLRGLEISSGRGRPTRSPSAEILPERPVNSSQLILAPLHRPDRHFNISFGKKFEQNDLIPRTM